MNDYEILRVIDFIEKTREPFAEVMPVSDEEPVWNIVAYLIKSEIKGQLVTAEGLVSPDQTRLVKANDDGSPVVTDGPFAESKEFIAGFWIINVKSADDAYKMAARVSSCPGPGGKPMNMLVEVRAAGEAPKTD